MKRRTLLLSGVGAAAVLVVGWGVLPARSRLGSVDSLPVVDGAVGLNGWIRIASDGGVVLAMNRSEMGQGVHTALAMLVAEELDVPLSAVRLEQAGPDKLYGNVAMFVGSLPFHPHDAEAGHQTRAVQAGEWITSKVARELGINATGGSSSVADAWGVLRYAAATARARLLGAASLHWKLPVEELAIKDGVIRHASGKQEHYGVFAQEAAATPTGTVLLKRRADWTLIGTAAPRIDLVSKTDGSARFGIDVRLPGQVYAAILHSPMFGGSPGAVKDEAAMKLPGVERLVRLNSIGGSTAAIEQSLVATARAAAKDRGGVAFHTRGDVQSAEKSASRSFEQLYSAPYLAHAAMEPINCTARVADGKVEVWAPTQMPGAARAIAASVARVGEDAVTVHVTYLGGGFGRRLDVDFVGQAVRIAIETNGRPVQLVWSREEDIRHDFYRPAGAALLQASLDAKGFPTALVVTSAGDAITPRWIERALPALAGPVDTPDKTTSEGLFDIPYGVPNQRIAHVATHSGVPVGFWRSVGHSHNAFFSEGFIDELAAEAKQDPVAFRLALLGDAPRHAAVLRLVAQKSGWGMPTAAGVARGVALHESFGSIVAQVAEVSIEDGRPRVRRVVCAADVGTVVNPGIVAQQMEGAIMFGLSAALFGRIDIERSAVRQSNFPDYRVARMIDTPHIETWLVPSTRGPSGVGEPGTPPIAPAVANALFVLTGQRIRSLPITL